MGLTWMQRLLLLLTYAAALAPPVPPSGGPSDGALMSMVSGIALAPGLVWRGARYGILFVGRAQGALSGAWAAAIHYRPPRVVGGARHQVTGGHWALRIPAGAGMGGSLRGRVVEGALVRDATAILAEVTLRIEINEGTGRYRGVTGTGTLVRALVDHGPSPPRLKGELEVMLTWPPQGDEGPS